MRLGNFGSGPKAQMSIRRAWNSTSSPVQQYIWCDRFSVGGPWNNFEKDLRLSVVDESSVWHQAFTCLKNPIPVLRDWAHRTYNLWKGQGCLKTVQFGINEVYLMLILLYVCGVAYSQPHGRELGIEECQIWGLRIFGHIIEFHLTAPRAGRHSLESNCAQVGH
jgi:hypothetical protein